MSGRYAFATLITSDGYLPGALALAAALKEIHPSPPVHPEVPFQTVCIVTPETVDVKTIKFLRKTFDTVIGVEVIEKELSTELKLLGRPDLHSVLTKLHVFRLTQYEKIVFLDADILPVQPLSHLFTLPHEFSAVSDVGWPDIFNSGMMVLTPGEDKFNDIMTLVERTGSWDGGDQGVLNEWRGSDWNRLSFTYNTTPTAAYTYAPAYERFGSQIKALHFIGPNKPWNEIPYRAPSSSAFVNQGQQQQPSDSPSLSSTLASAPSQSYAYSSLVDRWFDVYDRNYRSQVPLSDKEYEARKYENVWDQPSTSQAQVGVAAASSASSAGALGLDDLRRLAIEGGTSTFQGTGEGEYRSFPLEGRVDLMRPKEIAPPPEIRIQKATPPTQHSGANSSGSEQLPLQGQIVSAMESSPTSGLYQVPPSPHIAPVPLPSSGPPTPRASVLNPPSGNVGGQGIPSTLGTVHSESGEHRDFPPPSEAMQAGQSREGSRTSTMSFSQHQSRHQSEGGNETRQYYQPPQQSEGVTQHHQSYQPPHQDDSQIHHQQHSDQGQSQPSHEPPAPPAEPPRPASPPLLSWNPAVEPPPNVPPTPSAFPTEAYFPNAWDMPPAAAKLHAALTGSPPPTSSSSFFEAPPPSQIPSHLIQEGHYQNVMGAPPPDAKQPHNQPDFSKINSVFPWEHKPRRVPARTFPGGEVVPNANYIEDNPPEPEAEPELEASAPETKLGSKEEPPRMHIQIGSPPAAYPGASGYSNAWDSVPSIQKYASRLAKPVFPQSQPPPMASPRSRKRSDSYRSRGEQSDANSMDGDVEDEVDDNSESDTGVRLSSSERSEGEKKKDRSRGGSVSLGSSRVQGKKTYRSYGVQTIPKEVRSMAVQVSQSSSTSTGKLSGRPGSRRSSSSVSPVKMPFIDLSRPSTSQEMALNMEQSAVTTPSIANANVQPFSRASGSRQPSGMLSPRLHDAYTFSTPPRTPPNGSPGTQTPVARKMSQISKPPALDTQRFAVPSPPVNMRRTSSADTADSPLGPASPGDSPITQPPRKPIGRTWNPATGVDVFKRTSEEVLARFLRMGSWEDDSPSHK